MELKIKRSVKRQKTISGRVVNGVLEVSAPTHMTDRDLDPIIEKFRAQISRKQKRQAQRKVVSDQDLEQMAIRLNRQYFQDSLTWESITWSMRQNKRYGSCTPSSKTIRISHRLTSMPRFVQEYVVMHELAHLIEGNHGPKFWNLVNRYPLTERARGYLMAAGLEDVEAGEAVD